ncbi:glycoside hydrolase family 3 C-terminal domain-containing protein [Porticoccaceae bacterium]|nr:glycoside hydrolase family 3 C-terminal domain-containing protein [Porticoccaceae bacterium]
MRHLSIACAASIAFAVSIHANALTTDEKVEALLAKMTLEEKAGQLNQYSGYEIITGDIDESKISQRNRLVKSGLVGSVLNVLGTKDVEKAQRYAVEKTRLGIPLMFAFDVIHGYRTIFPIPLAEAASWDLEAMERSARIAAIEASAAGQNWTFAPMVDISHDPRWGRVMEGAGEDPYLGAQIAKARVRGFQGGDLSLPNTIAATAKHFAAYGEVIAGRDYNNVDISRRKLWETHLPPFKAALDEGVRSFMNAFNEFEGVPASANTYLVTDILRDQWDYKGVVVSDWDSFGAMVTSGVAANDAEAAEMSLEAGSDIDMESDVFVSFLPQLVRDGRVDESLVDAAVRRVLHMKYELGLFDDPYRYINAKREKDLILAPEHRAAARDMARKSVVLLKNDTQLLPLDKNIKDIAVIGPLGNNQFHMNGFWRGKGKAEDVVTLLDGIKAKVSANTRVRFAEGSGLESIDKKQLRKAVKLAKKSDVVILAIGEDADKTGESASRTNIELYPAQQELVKAIHKTGTPVVMVLMNGRPLAIEWSAEHIPSILNAWLLGSEAGNAIADVLFGDYNPSAKLTMTVPRNTGQIPIFYNTKRVSRPLDNTRYTSKYIDSSITPLYPFGYGLSYTEFSYSPITLSEDSISFDESLTASVTVTNSGKRFGEEVVQLYIQDMVGSAVRPVKELKGFKKIALKPNQSQTVSFTISVDDLAFYTRDMSFKAEAGDFDLMIGPSSISYESVLFKLSVN